MFDPINPPPTEHHGFATGHSTENGDSAKTVAQKVNDGFKHVYSLLREAGHTVGDAVEYVTAAAHKALNGRVDELEAEVRNLKMMVNGLGFAGARETITDPSHSMGFTHPTDLMIGGPVGTMISSEPIVSEPEKVTGLTSETFLGSSEPVVTMSEETEQ